MHLSNGKNVQNKISYNINYLYHKTKNPCSNASYFDVKTRGSKKTKWVIAPIFRDVKMGTRSCGTINFANGSLRLTYSFGIENTKMAQLNINRIENERK